ncbi:LuxR C-terminal-related transcriptional regulator [Microbacterium sp. NPDC056569]|uniref:LuxR C-terminal-related transcriptional regulator n=1 Tax=Microbacterium sp. NPDC056569 TaxID=3345867 RepID=UPI0036725E49
MTLLGRQDELAELAREVGRGIRFIGVSGRSGVGKTAMLSAFAAAPPPGVEVWDVDLAGAPGGSGVLDEAARRLGLGRSRSTSRTGVEAIAARVRDRRVVLSVDHSDELALDTDAVDSLFGACPRLALIVARAVPPERPAALITLRPLGVPGDGAAFEEIVASPSVRLFAARASLVDPHFRLDPFNAHDIAEICRLVGGLPLAIELIAARVRLLPVDQLVREMHGDQGGIGLDLLTARAGASRLSIRDALSSTCAQLSTRERRLLDRLSGFSGPFPFDTAVAVGGGRVADTLDDLEQLVDLRLIEPRSGVADQQVFDVLPIVRAYVRESWTPNPDDEEQRRVLLSDALRAAAASSESTVPSQALIVAQVMRRDLVNEARRLIEENAPLAAGWLTDCADVLSGFAEQTVVSELLERIIVSGVVDQLDAETRARVLLWSAYLLAMSPDGMGLTEITGERYRRAADLIRAGGWPLLSIRAAFLGIMIATVAGELVEATLRAEAGVARARKLPEQVWTGRFEVWLAAAAHAVGDIERASALALDVLEHGQRLHDSYTIVGAAVILHTLPPGTVPDAVPLPPLESVLELARATGDIAQEGFVLAALASASLDAGDYREAARWCAARLAQDSKRGWWLESEISLTLAVVIATGLGDFRFAARMLGAVRADRARILRAMAPRHGVALERAEATVVARLGSALSSRLIGAGQTLSIGDAAIEAMGWLRGHASGPSSAAVENSDPLTPRERQVLALLASGQTNKEIAARLGLSVKTVMHHSMAIYRKLDVRGRAEATALAFRRGLLDPPDEVS